MDFSVLSAIKFNDQHPVVANKIGDETPDWCLAAEAQSGHPMCAKR